MMQNWCMMDGEYNSCVIFIDLTTTQKQWIFQNNIFIYFVVFQDPLLGVENKSNMVLNIYENSNRYTLPLNDDNFTFTTPKMTNKPKCNLSPISPTLDLQNFMKIISL